MCIQPKRKNEIDYESINHISLFDFSKKLRRKLAGREQDADTDSYSDTEFDPNQEIDEKSGLLAEENIKKAHNNLELLEKRFGKTLIFVFKILFCSLGRYEGDIYQIQEWQIMVHVIQGRDFSGLEINPYVCIQIDDQKRYTGVQRSTNSPFFGEVNQTNVQQIIFSFVFF